MSNSLLKSNWNIQVADIGQAEIDGNSTATGSIKKALHGISANGPGACLERSGELPDTAVDKEACSNDILKSAEEGWNITRVIERRMSGNATGDSPWTYPGWCLMKSPSCHSREATVAAVAAWKDCKCSCAKLFSGVTTPKSLQMHANRHKSYTCCHNQFYVWAQKYQRN